MFGLDILQEIFATIKQNKLRTFLTGFSIAWGIFMLIVLLGSGNGLKNGMSSNFSHRAKNIITVWPGWASKPYKGFSTSRRIKFTNDDYEFIKNNIPNITLISAKIYRQVTASYGEEYVAPSLQGVYPDELLIENLEIVQGRFINDIDIEKKRKVAIIDKDTRDLLFKTKNPINEYIKIDKLIFQVVGVFQTDGNSNTLVYAPFTTTQMLYNPNKTVNRIDFCITDEFSNQKESDLYVENLRNLMGAKHKFDPTDYSALYVRNSAARAMQTNQIFNGISLFLWIIGIASLMAGIVGISNIMLITVKERTREFGIRKAIGAKPNSIIKLVLLESMFITATFGYIGMILGIALTETVAYTISLNQKKGESTTFLDPTIDLGVVISATILLLIAGTIAAYVPAKRAVSVSPIEAMRSE